MSDIFTILQDFLCYGNSQCAQIFNEYTYRPVVEGLFYTVFFPIVFILVFIFMLTNKIMKDHKGLNLLLSVAFFAFIILQGWYVWFMLLGKIWFVALIILGFFWLALYGLRPGGISGGGGSGGAPGRSGGLIGQALARVKVSLTKKVETHENNINSQLKVVDMIETHIREGDFNGAWRMAGDAINKLQDLKDQYLQLLDGPGGFKFGGRYKEYAKKIDDAIEKLQKREGELEEKKVKQYKKAS